MWCSQLFYFWSLQGVWREPGRREERRVLPLHLGRVPTCHRSVRRYHNGYIEGNSVQEYKLIFRSGSIREEKNNLQCRLVLRYWHLLKDIYVTNLYPYPIFILNWSGFGSCKENISYFNKKGVNYASVTGNDQLLRFQVLAQNCMTAKKLDFSGMTGLLQIIEKFIPPAIR